MQASPYSILFLTLTAIVLALDANNKARAELGLDGGDLGRLDVERFRVEHLRGCAGPELAIGEKVWKVSDREPVDDRDRLAGLVFALDGITSGRPQTRYALASKFPPTAGFSFGLAEAVTVRVVPPDTYERPHSGQTALFRLTLTDSSRFFPLASSARARATCSPSWADTTA